MTLEEAIDILKHSIDKEPTVTWGDYIRALKLGIEALKRERECRENMPREEWLLLPGEAEDN